MNENNPLNAIAQTVKQYHGICSTMQMLVMLYTFLANITLTADIMPLTNDIYSFDSVIRHVIITTIHHMWWHCFVLPGVWNVILLMPWPCMQYLYGCRLHLVNNRDQHLWFRMSTIPYLTQYLRHWPNLGAVSIRKTVFPGMAIPMLKIRRPSGRLIFNMEIAIRR